jgi:hypothetical protein
MPNPLDKYRPAGFSTATGLDLLYEKTLERIRRKEWHLITPQDLDLVEARAPWLRQAVGYALQREARQAATVMTDAEYLEHRRLQVQGLTPKDAERAAARKRVTKLR